MSFAPGDPAASRTPNWLAHQARVRPDRPALIAGGIPVSFAELDARAARAAAGLRALGVGRGDRVAVLAENRVEFVEIMHGLIRLGAVIVPLNSRLAAAEVERQLRAAGARLLVYGEAGRAAAAVPSGGRAVPMADVLGGAAQAAVEEEAIELGDLHAIVFTSGTSGYGRGVRLSYGNHFWSAIGSALNLGVRGDDRWLACLPFCHVGGLAIPLRGAIYGTTVVLHEGFDAERVNAAVDTERVTTISLVANMLRRMFDARGERPYPTWLRCVLAGGGPVPRSLLEEAAARGVPVAQTYGLTETASQVATLAPVDAVRKLGAAGKPLFGTEIAVLGPAGPLPAGAVGRIAVRGPTVSAGYVDGELPRREGWFVTGDLGHLDDEGFLFVAGRADDVIVTGGENVHPAEVERAVESHPDVAECCVVGVPDERWGEAVVACVRPRPGAAVDADDIRRHARTLLAPFKVPKRVVLVGELPRGAVGKIQRRVVRAALTTSG